MEVYQKTGRAPEIRRKDGVVRYPYTVGEIPIFCRRMLITRIQLEEGETVVGKPMCGACWTEEGVSQGTSEQAIEALWEVTGMLSGPEGRRTQHIIVKPREFSRETNLMFGTDKGRIYNLKLVPKAKHRDQVATFYYPQNLAQTFAAMQRQVGRERAAQQPRYLPCGFSLPPEQLDQSYRVEGEPVWVANDGKTTCLRPSMVTGDLPVLFTPLPDGGHAVVNYRVQDGHFQVDGVPAVLSLVSGTGEGKVTTTITRVRQ
jgi:type IV secretory pathway VirB9-like protein